MNVYVNNHESAQRLTASKVEERIVCPTTSPVRSSAQRLTASKVEELLIWGIALKFTQSAQRLTASKVEEPIRSVMRRAWEACSTPYGI